MRYINADGKESRAFRQGFSFANGYALAYSLQGPPVLIDQTFYTLPLEGYIHARVDSDKVVVLLTSGIETQFFALGSAAVAKRNYLMLTSFRNGVALTAEPSGSGYRVDRLDKSGNVLASLDVPENETANNCRGYGLLISDSKTDKPKYALTSDFRKIPLTYDSVGQFENGNAVVAKNKKLGLINLNWEEVVAPQFTYIDEEGHYARTFSNMGLWGVIDLKTKKASTARYGKIESFGEFGEHVTYVPEFESYIDSYGKLYRGKKPITALEKAEKRELEKYEHAFDTPLTNDLGKEIWDKTTYNAKRIDAMNQQGLLDINKLVRWSKGEDELPLVVAVKQKNTWMFNHFIRLGADVTKLSGSGIGLPTHYYVMREMASCPSKGCRDEFYNMLETLLNTNNSNINQQFGSMKSTMLHVAAERKLELRVIELLLKHGADSSLKDGTSQTPYEYVKSMRKSYVEWLGEEYVINLMTLLKPEKK